MKKLAYFKNVGAKTMLAPFYLMGLLSIVFIAPVSAQNDTCATRATPFQLLFMDQHLVEINDYIQFRKSFLVSLIPKIQIPVKIHLIRDSLANNDIDGAGTQFVTVDSAKIAQTIDSLNVKFDSTDFEFVLCNPINFIDNQNFYDLLDTIETAQVIAANDVKNMINICYRITTHCTVRG